MPTGGAYRGTKRSTISSAPGCASGVVRCGAGLLAIAAMVTLAAGVVVPTALSVAVKLAATMLAFALSLIGIVEGARLVAGQSCLASRMLEVVRR